MLCLTSILLSVPLFFAMVYFWFVLSSFVKLQDNLFLERSTLELTGKQREDLRLDDLLILRRDQLVGLFHQLQAPSFEEMSGEYRAVCLDCGGALRQMLSDVCLHRLWGKWQCKAFKPLEANQGYGYNSFRASRANRNERVLPALFRGFARGVSDYLWGAGDEVVVRIIRMKTALGDSVYDKGQSFHLVYHDYTPYPISTMKDEVRKVNDTLYLGLGILGFSFGRRNIFPFALVGPPDTWVGPDAEVVNR